LSGLPIFAPRRRSAFRLRPSITIENSNFTRASLSLNIGGTLNSNGTASDGTPDMENIYTYDYLQRMTGIEQTDAEGASGVASKYVAMETKR